MEVSKPAETPQAFTVEEPPAPAPKPKKAGRENISAKAVEFCSANPEQWCKVFGYSFTDAQTRHTAHSAVRSRKVSMKRIAESLGVVIDFTHAVDEALSRHDLYAKVSTAVGNE
jgi:hypothetical protein